MIKEGDVKKPVQAEDMSTRLKYLAMFFFLQSLQPLLDGLLPKMILGSPFMGTQAIDAFIFACLPIIAFYISLWVRAKGQDKKGIGALLFIFAIAIAFWTIYNQNATGLTLWAEKHTDRLASPTTAKITGKLFPLQEVT